VGIWIGREGNGNRIDRREKNESRKGVDVKLKMLVEWNKEPQYLQGLVLFNTLPSLTTDFG
jgi:hypothetical protein